MQRVDQPQTKPILRLQQRDDFNLIPPELAHAIAQQTGVAWDIKNFDIRLIRDDESYEPHYLRRVDIIRQAANFLIDSPKAGHLDNESKKTLINQIEDFTAECMSHLSMLKSGEIAHYQNSLHHYAKHLAATIAAALNCDKKTAMELLDRAEQFVNLAATRPTVCTVTTNGKLFNEHEFIVQIDAPQNPFEPNLIAELMIIKNDEKAIPEWVTILPEWFTVLSADDKILLQHFLSQHNASEFGTVINALSSKLRIIPAPANYGKHTLLTFLQNKLQVHSPEFRSSHIASRDVSSKHEQVRAQHARRNLRKEVDDAINDALSRRSPNDADNATLIPILHQTLISPIKDPDSRLDADRNKAALEINHHLSTHEASANHKDISFAFMISNHPLNYFKYAAATSRLSTGENSTAQNIKTLIHLIQANQPKNQAIRDTVNSLIQSLHDRTMVAWSVDEYRELYLSSLEQLSVGIYGGITIGSCVSGKDRKGVEIAHTDAVKIYFALYGKIPPMNDQTETEKQEMQIFARIFADVYCTKHQMALAEMNAPGSFGIKTPAMYLPEQLKEAVKQWYVDHADLPGYQDRAKRNLFDESDVMASNNEVDHIKEHDIPAGELDVSWKPGRLTINDRHPMEAIIPEADKAIGAYLVNRKSRLGKLSRWSGDISGELRACVYNKLLKHEGLNTFQKAVLLAALLSSSSTNLKHDIVQVMGFEDTKQAAAALDLFLALNARQEGISQFSHIQETVSTIRKTIDSLKTHDQIERSAETITASLKALTPDQTIVASHQPH